MVRWLVGGYLLLTVYCLPCGEEEGAKVPDFLGVFDFLLLWHLLRTVLEFLSAQSAHRLFFRSREANHRDQEPLPDATWVLELDGSQWIIQAILHALHMHRPGFVSPG